MQVTLIPVDILPCKEGLMNIAICMLFSIENERKTVIQIMLTIMITAVKDSRCQYHLYLWHDRLWDFVGFSGNNS